MTSRFKLDSRSATAVYHCISHTVRKEFLDDHAKEIFRKQLWQVADYCGIQVLTYAIMSNHFHVLARVPLKTKTQPVRLHHTHHINHPLPPAPVHALAVLLEIIRVNPELAHIDGDSLICPKMSEMSPAIWDRQEETVSQPKRTPSGSA